AHRRDPGAVRALDVRGPLVSDRRLPQERSRPRPRSANGRPGHADAGDDPPRLAAGLLALRARRRRTAPRVVAPNDEADRRTETAPGYRPAGPSDPRRGSPAARRP